MPNVVFANFVNQLMTAVPAGAHVRALTAPSARKIWYADAGDMLVLPLAPDRAFLEYACAILDIRQSDVEVVVPAGPLDEYLATRVLNDSASRQRVQAYQETHPTAALDVFVQDSVSTEFSRAIGLSFRPYDSLPSRSTLAVISRLNTKSGFKDLAAGLGIRTVPGELALGQTEAKQVASRMFERSAPLVVKIDRGSNGYGHSIIQDEDDLRKLDSSLNRFYEQPDRYVIEPLLSFVDLPSIEFEITDVGPEFMYVCNMRCVNNAWTGMVTPARTLSADIVETLHAWGRLTADFLFFSGYRGTFDIDCGITDSGELFATESNCRNTGGTYLYRLLKRLYGKEASSVTWLADSHTIANSLPFEAGLDRVQKAGLAWNLGARAGVIFTSNTRHIDQKWRYLVVGRTDDEVQTVEAELLGLLGGE